MLTASASTNKFGAENRYSRRQNGGVMYGWRARIGNISPTACAEILPYEFYRVAPEGEKRREGMGSNLELISQLRGSVTTQRDGAR